MTTLILALLLAACGREPAPAAPRVPVEAPPPPPPADARLPDAPIYDLSLALVDQQGAAAGLDRYRGQPVILSMFYAGCKSACPLLINAIQGIEDRLSPEARAPLRVLMVSFDPDNDTPEALAALGEAHHLDPARWTLARASEGDLRLLAAVLGIAYNRLSDGGFNHSSVLVLADATGRPVARLPSLSADQSDFVAAIEGLAARAQP